MPADNDEIESRRETALTAIRQAFGTEQDEYGATLFVTHHLKEIEPEYWQKQLGTARPEPRQVLDILELRSHWGDEDGDGIDTFDFSLPGDITNYVVSVSFNEDGQVEQITMES